MSARSLNVQVLWSFKFNAQYAGSLIASGRSVTVWTVCLRALMGAAGAAGVNRFSSLWVNLFFYLVFQYLFLDC